MSRWLLAAALLVAAALLIAGFLIFRPGGRPLFVDYYRVVDEDTLIVGTSTSDGVETRVTAVDENDQTVTITVQTFTVVFGPSAGTGHRTELSVELDRPLEDRQVFDPYHEVPESENAP